MFNVTADKNSNIITYRYIQNFLLEIELPYAPSCLKRSTWYYYLIINNII